MIDPTFLIFRQYRNKGPIVYQARGKLRRGLDDQVRRLHKLTADPW